MIIRAAQPGPKEGGLTTPDGQDTLARMPSRSPSREPEEDEFENRDAQGLMPRKSVPYPPPALGAQTPIRAGARCLELTS